MSDLETLKREHPEWCFTCGKWYLMPGGIHTCFENPILAAVFALVQQHEATIAELEQHNADLRRDVQLLTCDSDFAGRLAAQAELAKAQATIQQQARELEEALGNILNYSNDPPLVKYAQEALVRQSARSQQAEAKGEE